MEYKSPVDELIFTADFTTELGANDIATAAWTLEAPLTSDTEVIAGKTATLRILGGGVAGTVYRIQVKIVSNGSPTETFDKEYFLTVRRQLIG